MKIQLKLAAALAALLMTSSAFPVYAASADRLPETTASSQTDTSISDRASPEEWETLTLVDPFPSEAPVFSAHIEYSPQGYVVRGTFTEFLPGTSLVRPLYSLDGEVWQGCQTTWNLQWLGKETADDLERLQNQTCLYSTHEPLAGYLAGQLDRFYLKLQITLESGITYETQAAVIDRGAPQPIPEEFNPVADFVSAMRIRQWSPFKSYGQFQITVSADAASEDISLLLPDTLPIEIQLYAGIDFITNAIVDCPVTWKPFSLSQLTAGESVTIEDAAEEIIVPAGTLLNTPTGIYQLNEPLDIDYDEIRLILNVIAENAAPAGVLADDINGLQISFYLKPTGATAIRAYTLSADGSDWVELPDCLLPEEVNAPSSTASSTYTLILGNTSEPYRSYLTALNAGDEPVPFLLGLKIEGGVYDGRQLILAWPDTYDLPTKLPALNGVGGNEGNAGAGNSGDSTAEGQRPNLPQEPETGLDFQDPQDPKGEQNVQNREPPQDPKDVQNAQESKNRQTEQLRPHEDETDGHAAGKDDSFTQLSTAETVSSPNTGAENGLQWFAAAMIPIGICIIIAARKADTPG